jgi:hypothetical protein
MKYVYAVYEISAESAPGLEVLGSFESLRQARKCVRGKYPKARLTKWHLTMGCWFYEAPKYMDPYGWGKVAVDIYRYKKDTWEILKKYL